MRADLETAFEEFVVSRQARLFRVAFLLTADRQHAEDLLQSTLERTYQHWRRVAAAETPDAYVHRIMVNLANDWWRSRRHAVVETLKTGVAMRSAGDCGTGQVDQRDLLIRALRRLPAGMRAVLVLRYFEDMSEGETAVVMGCSVGNVKSQASRGLQKLREAVDGGQDVIGLPKRSAS